MKTASGGIKGSGQKFGQKLVNQTPVYDRVMKCHRPRKKKGGGVKWL